MRFRLVDTRAMVAAPSAVTIPTLATASSASGEAANIG